MPRKRVPIGAEAEAEESVGIKIPTLARDYDREQWEEVEELASVVFVCVPLVRMRHKKTGEMRAVELLTDEHLNRHTLCIPVAFAASMALQAAGLIFASFIPKSPTLAAHALKDFEFHKDNLKFEIETGEDGATRLVVIKPEAVATVQ